MIRAGFGFQYFYSFILTQFSEDTPDVSLDLTIYRLSPIFWCKDYVILAVPATMRQAFRFFFFLLHDIPPSILCIAVGKPTFIVSREVYLFYA